MCDRHGHDRWRAALFRFSGQNENMGQQNYHFTEQLFKKIWAGADGAGLVIGLFWTPLNESDSCQTNQMYALSAYNYKLPPELIAQRPADRRDQSNLLVME